MNYAESPPKSFIYAGVRKKDPNFSPLINIKTDNIDETLSLLCALYEEILSTASKGDKNIAQKIIDDVNRSVIERIHA